MADNSLATIAAVFVGGSLSFATSFLVPMIHRIHEKKDKRINLLSAIKAEAEVIIELIDRRQYFSVMAQALSDSQSVNQPQYVSMRINRNSLIRTYESNLKDLVLLPQNINKRVVRFYMLFDALMDDMPILSGQEKIEIRPFLKVIENDSYLLSSIYSVGKELIEDIEAEQKYYDIRFTSMFNILTIIGSFLIADFVIMQSKPSIAINTTVYYWSFILYGRASFYSFHRA